MLVEKLKTIPLVRPAYHFFLAFLSALLNGFPSKKIFVIGVTGTKGKTTALEILNAILEANGEKTALLSSLTVKIAAERRKNTTDTTMPGRFFIQQFLARAARAGCRYALVEVTSQGIVQHRHRFIRYRAAGITNLHPEHIESHGSFEKYRAAKARFLRYAAQQGAKIFINEDDEHAAYFTRAATGAEIHRYSARDLSLSLLGVREHPMHAIVKSSGHENFFETDFNRANAALAASIATTLGISENNITEALRKFTGVSGRMEYVQHEPFTAVVDYAHTPDSLEAVYQSLKSKERDTHSRLICILGSAGGGRDTWKRPKLGEIAARYCDILVLTDEDPYEEDPAEIIHEIERGIPQFKLEDMDVYRILDRREALHEAAGMAQAGDVVVVTGKGSEQWIHTKGGAKIPWSDIEILREALAPRK